MTAEHMSARAAMVRIGGMNGASSPTWGMRRRLAISTASQAVSAQSNTQPTVTIRNVRAMEKACHERD